MCRGHRSALVFPRQTCFIPFALQLEVCQHVVIWARDLEVCQILYLPSGILDINNIVVGCTRRSRICLPCDAVIEVEAAGTLSRVLGARTGAGRRLARASESGSLSCEKRGRAVARDKGGEWAAAGASRGFLDGSCCTCERE